MKFTSLLFAGLAAAIPGHRAVYFLDNDPEGASIVSLQVGRDGKLSHPVRTSTGGNGQFALNVTSGEAPMADTLFSQNSVVSRGKLLFSVNPGSNTISMFRIPYLDPTYPKLLATAPVAGQFPNSVAYSPYLNLVCAVSTGAEAGVSCFRPNAWARNSNYLTPVVDLPIPAPTNQSTPPVGPPKTASDIVFSPDDKLLAVTIKGDPATPGYVVVFPIGDDGVPSAADAVTSRPDELRINFSLSFLGAPDRALVTDAAMGGALLRFQDDYTVDVERTIPVENQSATCWSVYSARHQAVYMFDGGSADPIVVDPATGAIRGTIASGQTGGSFDSIIGRDYLYVLRADAGINVFGLATGKANGRGKYYYYGKGMAGNGAAATGQEEGMLVQSVDLSGLGSRQGWMGMAYYPTW